MANTGITVPDEDLEEFDTIIRIKAMLGELETDRRSPVIQDLIREYNEENKEYLEQWEDFVEGNENSRGAPALAQTG